MYNITNSTEVVFGDVVLSNYSQYIIASFLILMTVTGIVGNGLTIFSVFLSTKLQTKTNVFLVNLACCDLITCFFAPLQVVALLTPYEPSVPESVPAVYGMFVITPIFISILTLTMIAIIRCVKITRSENIYKKLFTKLKITLIIIGIWVLVGAICVSSYSINESLWFIYDSKIKMYKPELSNSPGNVLSVVILATDTIYLVVCISVILTCYIKIALHVKAHTRRIAAAIELNPLDQVQQQANRDAPASSHQAAENRELPMRQVNQQRQVMANRFRAHEVTITKNLLVVTIVFLICFLPFPFLVNSTNAISYIVGICLCFSNSAMNPLIYAFKHKDFQKVFRCIVTGSLRKIPFPSRPLRAMLQTM